MKELYIMLHEMSTGNMHEKGNFYPQILVVK